MKAIQCVVAVMLLVATMPGAAQRQGAAPTDVAISGELQQWHKVTLTLTGPQADESSTAPNPFTDYRMTVTFAHESGTPTYRVPGYFAGDGDAANSSATSGNKWRAHVAPDKTGRWTYRVSLVTGKGVALAAASEGQRLAPFDGRSGTFQVTASDKKSPDFRARGRLQYAGKHYLQFAGSSEYFLKLGRRFTRDAAGVCGLRRHRRPQAAGASPYVHAARPGLAGRRSRRGRAARARGLSAPSTTSRRKA